MRCNDKMAIGRRALSDAAACENFFLREHALHRERHHRRVKLWLVVDGGVHDYPGYPPELGAEAPAERGFMRKYPLRSSPGHEIHTSAERYCSRRVYGPALESVREEIRLLDAFAGAAGRQ